MNPGPFLENNPPPNIFFIFTIMFRNVHIRSLKMNQVRFLAHERQFDSPWSMQSNCIIFKSVAVAEILTMIHINKVDSVFHTKKEKLKNWNKTLGNYVFLTEIKQCFEISQPLIVIFVSSLSACCQNFSMFSTNRLKALLHFSQ